MIDPVSFLLIIFFSVGLSHLLLPRDPGSRLFWIVTPGVLLLFMIHPLALAFALACFAFSTGIFAIGRTLDDPALRTRIPYAILFLLFVPDIMKLTSHEPILWLGSAFFIIRQMMTVERGIKKKAALGQFLPALLLSTFFVAALPSGPVFNGFQCLESLRKHAARDYREGGYRLLEGLAYLFAVSGFAGAAITMLERAELQDPELGGLAVNLLLKLVAVPIASFGFLFATFYGYSRMAEGSALLFGFEVPQNFDKPHLARDLGDFWKRWHRSMAGFVMQYIYLPLLVTTSRAKLSLIGAFTFMGLWHDFSLSFLLWGIGHGVGLAFLMPWLQRRSIDPSVVRLGSLAYVIMLSGVAHGVWST